MIIVTGGIACGKTTFMEVARRLGYECVCADEWFRNEFKGQRNDKIGKRAIFKNADIDLKEVAFKHPDWHHYELYVDKMFEMYLWIRTMANTKTDFLFIPDYFKRHIYTDSKQSVLTIERGYNLKYAVERDVHRNQDLTVAIHQHQMDPGRRMSMADFVLRNEGTKEEFEKECEKWLKQHSPEVSTPSTAVTNS